MEISHSYTSLGEEFFEAVPPTPVRDPALFLWNAPLARQIGVTAALAADKESLAQIFAGNRLLPGSKPVALAYAGHQFGNFVPQLGDGRAHLLGEVLDAAGRRFDLQLKGSGPSRFSRRGDGRCALGPAVREFIMSEAMHALGVPTTRCLAVVTTGEPVYRESRLPGAVVTRVAASHIRVGTFEYFAARGDKNALEKLVSHVIARHYPEIDAGAADKYPALLRAVMQRQIALVVEWMRVGFIHGVMNTDNTAISGETIDFGPCAMMNSYDPDTAFSSIDVHGRYAFSNQPGIAQWNMAKFAESMLPLFDGDQEQMAAEFSRVIGEFPDLFRQAWSRMMTGKLGLTEVLSDDQPLVMELLRVMAENRLDYTNTFDALTRSLREEAGASGIPKELEPWAATWRERLAKQGTPQNEIFALMRRHNPVGIPRNHHMEAVIAECVDVGEKELADKFLKVLRSPYEDSAETSQFQDPPPASQDRCYQTFCGT